MSDELPAVGAIYKHAGAHYKIDKIGTDGWIFITNTRTQARHRVKLAGLQKRYTFVSPF